MFTPYFIPVFSLGRWSRWSYFLRIEKKKINKVLKRENEKERRKKQAKFVHRKEVNVIRGTSYIRGVTMSFIIFSTRMSLFITVLSYVLFGFKITAEKVFMITAYYNILRTTMTVFFPQGVYWCVYICVAHVIN